ncbi:MAG TPA: SDR family oxidoreductase [Verrucomicrobiae bacterium]
MGNTAISPRAQTAWITGAGGLIGNCFLQSAAEFGPQWTPRGLTRQIVDLADAASVRRLFAAEQPVLVIHCAALSKSPACQANPALARQLNVEVTQTLVELAVGIPFVFFSSDLVFDGRQGNYVETDTPGPLSVYAETKVAAEQIVRQHPRHLIIRTSLNGGTSPTGDRGFNEEMRRAWQAGRTLRLFTDEYRSPIAAVETTRAVWRLIAANATGIHHVAGSERLSRWRIGELLAARWPQLQPRIEPASLREYQGAPRPPDTSLNCDKAEQVLGAPLPRFSNWLLAHPDERF